jgi:hypothetical protein
MKKCFVVIQGVVLGFVLCSCGGSDGVDCNARLEKTKKCHTNVNETEYMEVCNQIEDMYQQSYIDAGEPCLDKPCADQDACYTQATTVCNAPSNVSTTVDTLCNKIHECEPETPVETCKTQYGAFFTPIFSCMNSSFLSTFSTCVDKITCGENDDPMKACFPTWSSSS